MNPPGTIVITGGNVGLGFQCARAVLRRDSQRPVILACRNPVRAQSAVDKLRGEFGETSRVYALELDLGSLASIRRFTDVFRDRPDLPRLSGLVCNAGVQTMGELRQTKDGFEETFGVNHLGHFLLINRLLCLFRVPSRIVLVSSGTHNPEVRTGLPAPAPIEPETLAHPPLQPGPVAPALSLQWYTTSKLCNVLCAYALARKLQGAQASPDIGVFAVDPGFIPETSLTRDLRWPLGWTVRHLLPAIRPLLRLYTPYVESAERAGEKLAELLTHERFTGKTGIYLTGVEESKSSADSYDVALSDLLWRESARLVGLMREESQLFER